MCFITSNQLDSLIPWKIDSYWYFWTDHCCYYSSVFLSMFVYSPFLLPFVINGGQMTPHQSLLLFFLLFLSKSRLTHKLHMTQKKLLELYSKKVKMRKMSPSLCSSYFYANHDCNIVHKDWDASEPLCFQKQENKRKKIESRMLETHRINWQEKMAEGQESETWAGDRQKPASRIDQLSVRLTATGADGQTEAERWADCLCDALKMSLLWSAKRRKLSITSSLCSQRL